jgi:bacteriorhodopsin
MISNIINYLNSYKLFAFTLHLSIAVQVITGFIEFFALFVSVDNNIKFLKEVLVIECIVQIIELLFYIWLFINLQNVTNITSKRYFDWVITTPTMLFTLVMYLIYTNSDNPAELNLYEQLYENKSNIIIITFLNLLMLIFGYLGETEVIHTFITLTCGFIPFIVYFWIIYENYAKYSDFGKKLFYYFLIVWTFYGIVAYLPYYLRNSCYNILDLFAKNFFGVYLSFIILKNADYNKYLPV